MELKYAETTGPLIDLFLTYTKRLDMDFWNGFMEKP